MAGGFGAGFFPTTAPMVIPQDPPSEHLLPVPQIKSIKNVKTGKPARTALPAIGSEFTMSSGRQREAEEYAAAMGQAFAITKAQNKHQKAKAKARGRAAQHSAEKRKRR